MVRERVEVHQVVALSEDIGMSLEVADAGVVTTVTERGAHDVVLPLPWACGTVAHGIAEGLRTAGGGIGTVVMAVALIEPRTFLIVLDMRQFRHLTFERDHILAKRGIERVGITPIEPRLSVIVGIDGGVDVEPVALVPHQRFAQGIAERTIGRVTFQDADAMSVQRCIEVVLAVTLDGLDGPGTVVTAAPGEVLERSHSAMLRPVHHIGG